MHQQQNKESSMWETSQPCVYESNIQSQFGLRLAVIFI